jgi:hypothetical protein
MLEIAARRYDEDGRQSGTVEDRPSHVIRLQTFGIVDRNGRARPFGRARKHHFSGLIDANRHGCLTGRSIVNPQMSVRLARIGAGVVKSRDDAIGERPH